MQYITLSIEESRYELLLQFLSTLDYVRVVPPSAISNNGRSKRTRTPKNRAFLEGMKTTSIPVGHTNLNREEIYGDRV